jgi:hypothetical protein
MLSIALSSKTLQNKNNVNANQLAFTLPLLPELHKDAERLLRELRCHIKVFSQARVRPRLIEEG